MNGINGVQSSLPIHTAVNQPIQKPLSAEPTGRNNTSDRLELSGVSHLIKSLKANSGVRTEKVATIKAQIEAGTYEDDHKLNVAADRMLDDVL